MPVVDKVTFEPVLETPCHAHLLPGTNGGSVTTSIHKRRNSSETSLVKSRKLILCLTGVILVQVVGLVYLIYDKLVHSDIPAANHKNISASCTGEKYLSSSDSENNLQHRDYDQFPLDLDYVSDYDYVGASLGDASESNISAASHQYDQPPWDVYDIKPRCFSMCEPPELFFREEKFSFFSFQLAIISCTKYVFGNLKMKYFSKRGQVD